MVPARFRHGGALRPLIQQLDKIISTRGVPWCYTLKGFARLQHRLDDDPQDSWLRLFRSGWG